MFYKKTRSIHYQSLADNILTTTGKGKLCFRLSKKYNLLRLDSRFSEKWLRSVTQRKKPS
jgi:hypothetical protein